MTSRQQNSLAAAIFTTTQQRLLALLFGQPDRAFFLTELIELSGGGRGAMQRELSRLEASALVSAERIGNRKYYRANPEAPIFNELCSIIGKTVGLEEQIRISLEPLDKDISLSLIYGSIAKQTDTAESDIDLLVVSDNLTLENLYAQLATVEKQLGRQINPTLYSSSEFKKRRKNDNPFLKKILETHTHILQGNLDGE